MNILIDIGHPAHVHVFRNFYYEMTALGHDVHFTAKDKECTVELLDCYGLSYTLLGTPYNGAINKAKGLFVFGKRLHSVALEKQVDLFLSISSMYAAHVASMMGKPHIVMDDTEHSSYEHMLYKPFSSIILTPSCFLKNMGKKQLRYDGFHELAYLHQDRFAPDERIHEKLGLDQHERYAVLRFVSWNAGHDINAKGLSLANKRKVVTQLQEHCRVFISSEKELPADLEELRITLPAHQMHDVLASADLYVGEGATMASECAMLGTPAIYINSLDAGTLQEQESYGLIKGFRSFDGVSETIASMMAMTDLRRSFANRAKLMLEEKVDVTAMLVELSHRICSSPRLAAELVWYNKKNAA